MHHWFATRLINCCSLVLVFSACGPAEDDVVRMDETLEDLSEQVLTGYTQGTTYTIITGDPKLLVTKDDVDKLLAQFDTSLSGYIPSSMVSRFNKSKGELLTFEDKHGFFSRCLEKSMEVYELTDGAFDPSVYPLVAGWGFLKDPKLEMSAKQIDSLLAYVGFRKDIDFVYRKESGSRFTLGKKRPGLKLDFNAIAQGQSVDEVAAFLESRGHANYFVEIGGEIKVKGRNREGHFWRIGIDAPKESNDGREEVRDITNVVNLKMGAIATSGNYRKFYEKDGVKYSHTINPKTGYPVQHSLLSATVWTDNCAMADALATAFMVMGVEETKTFLQKHHNLKIEVLLIFQNEKGRMEKFFTPGMRKFLDEGE
jgi:FAD:protein FMN transferase